MKRLRKVTGPGIKFYACGEYGDKKGRPHYHAAIFGYDFKDKILLNAGKKSWQGFNERRFKFKGEYDLYQSDLLNSIWGLGFASIGELNMNSAGYVARYCMKKISGEGSEEVYQGKCPEFSLMSRGNAKTGPNGIGLTWFEKYSGDVYPKDFFTVNGIKQRPPRYYDSLMEKKSEKTIKEVKIKREKKMHKIPDDGAVRREARHKYKLNQTKSLRRELHDE